VSGSSGKPQGDTHHLFGIPRPTQGGGRDVQSVRQIPCVVHSILRQTAKTDRHRAATSRVTSQIQSQTNSSVKSPKSRPTGSAPHDPIRLDPKRGRDSVEQDAPTIPPASQRIAE